MSCSTSYSAYYAGPTVENPAYHAANDRVMQQRGPGSTSATDNTYLTAYAYDTKGSRVRATDPLGRVTTIAYTDGTTAGESAGGYAAALAPASLPWRIVKPGGGVQTTARAHQYAAGARRDSGAQVQPPGGVGAAEPDDHALGRSRGGFTTKLHLSCEQACRPMSLLLTAGPRGDSPQFVAVLEGIRVPRLGGGRPRTRPDRVRADKAYSSRGNRAYLWRSRIKAAIPIKAGQAANRRKKGSAGRRPPAFDPVDYRLRNAVERGISLLKQHRAVATRFDKLAVRHLATVQIVAINRWL